MAADEGVPERKLRLCQLDSYMRKLNTKVISCTDVVPTPGAPAAADASPLYAVVLEDSPLYPEGGGQPCDAGVLRLVRSGAAGVGSVSIEFPIESVMVDSQGQLVHHMRQQVEAGAEVEVEVDWRRRMDHMQQHTGQHIVSAVVEIIAGADTVSWELHPTQWKDTDAVYVDLSCTTLSEEQITTIEQRCNDEVRGARAVSVIVVDPVVDPAGLAAIKAHKDFRGALPPAGKTGSALRLIHVDGLDINACGGTHVRNTVELQLIKLVGIERAKGGVRLKFVVGDRAIAALGRSLTREARLTTKLMCGPDRHEQAVDTLQKDRGVGSKARKALAEEVAALLGKELAAGLPATGGVAALHRIGGDLDFLTWVANVVLETRPTALLLLSADGGDTPPAFAAPAAAAKGKGKGDAAAAPPAAAPTASAPAVYKAPPPAPDAIFLLAGQADLVKSLGPAVATMLAGKGGGRPGRYQGKAGSLEQLPEALLKCQEAEAARSV